LDLQRNCPSGSQDSPTIMFSGYSAHIDDESTKF
jgi:hypothetical protein